MALRPVGPPLLARPQRRTAFLGNGWRQVKLGAFLLAVMCGGLVACRSAPADASPQTPYLDAALRTGRWLQGLADPGLGGAIPDETDASAPPSPHLDTGAAGRVIFFLELFAATGDSSFLESAEREGEFALNAEEGDSSEMGLYDGRAGVAFALTELGKMSSRPDRYRQAALRGFERIAASRGSGRRPSGWGRSNDILAGTAGIGLALLYAGREFGKLEFIKVARRAGEDLIGSAESMRVGRRWHRWSDRQLDLPNFSHGTAGVAYFLAALHQADGGDRFRAAAESGAEYLMNVADQSDGLFLVPYGIPDRGYATKYDIGWAHGPAGTARLFYRLWRITGDDRYRAVVDASAQSLLSSGIPGPTADSIRWAGPFNLDRRFGTSGAVSFLLDWRRVEGDEQYAALARRSADQILVARVDSLDGSYWRLPRYPFLGPAGDTIYTGYFYGAAGIGLALLEMHYSEVGKGPRIRLPDDPFPAQSRAP